MQKASRTAFTLIELLIVVAIIEILAAIAVPNFLEAQTRAKVSRIYSDMRTLATGLEAYRIDRNAYPTRKPPNPLDSPSKAWRQVTTPVGYLTLIPKDPFFLVGLAKTSGPGYSGKPTRFIIIGMFRKWCLGAGWVIRVLPKTAAKGERFCGRPSNTLFAVGDPIWRLIAPAEDGSIMIRLMA